MTAFTIDKLQQLASKYPWLINAQVFFKLGQGIPEHRRICEIELSAPGPRIYASSSASNFEMAAKKTMSDLEKQLKKRKAIFTAHS